jgi:hypothetical protein
MLALCKRELRCCDPKIGVSNKKAESIVDNYQLEYPEDIAFIKSKAQQYTATLLGAFATPSPAGPNSKAATCRKLDRMRFIECMAQDHIKPLYFTTNEVMSRAELDSRNSTTAGARRNDFFEEITKEFNNEKFCANVQDVA